MIATSRSQKDAGYDDANSYRRTPQNQSTVPEIVKRGMAVRSSYNTGGIVLSVDGPYSYTGEDGQEYEHYSLVYVDPRYWTDRQPQRHSCWINELVAVDGRLLKLFEANTDEVFVVDATPRPDEDKTGQLSFF